MNGLDRAPHDSLELLHHWYDEDTGGDNFLQGIEAGLFRDQSCREDLITLDKRPGLNDPITLLVSDKLVPVWDRCIGHRFNRTKSATAFHDVREYHIKTLILFGNVICMLLSAVMPALAILVLYNMQSMMSRLIAIVLMSLMFSLIMTVVSSRKADVFMSTTAFAAVLVVFVGSSSVIDGAG